MRVRLKPFLAVIATAVLLAPAVGAAARMRRAAALESALVSEVNDVRRAHGLHTVRPSPDLGTAAVSHSREMGANGFFAHRSADGTVFWQRIRRYYPYPREGTWSVGENLVWTVRPLNAAELLQLWLDSPAHREVLFSPKWREVGLGAVKVEDAPGFYGGRDVTLVTADFGARTP